MQRFDDKEGNGCKAHIQHQCCVVAFFDTLRFVCAKVLGNIWRNRIADGHKNQRNFLKFHHRNQVILGIEKARKMAYFRDFLAFLSCRLSLAELRCATSGFEAVLTYPWSKKSSIYAGFRAFLSQ